MSEYISQGIATMRYGVTFRSKLEAVWAEFYNETETEWEYIDTAWADFEVINQIDGSLLHVEIKPIGPKFLFNAVQKAWDHREKWPKTGDQNRMLIACGEPSVMQAWLIETNPQEGFDHVGYATEVTSPNREFWIVNGSMMSTETLKEVLDSHLADIRKAGSGSTTSH